MVKQKLLDMARDMLRSEHQSYRTEQAWWSRKKSSPRWKTGSRFFVTLWKYWTPAFAGMTENGIFRLFTKPSSLEVASCGWSKVINCWRRWTLPDHPPFWAGHWEFPWVPSAVSRLFSPWPALWRRPVCRFV